MCSRNSWMSRYYIVYRCRALLKFHSDHAKCINNIGSYRCTCIPGYEPNLRHPNECVDRNECRDHPCHVSEECINIVGSYICKSRGQIYKQWSIIITCLGTTCGRGLKWSEYERRCKDIDECLENTHDCASNEKCKNTYKSYRCEPNVECEQGFSPDQYQRRCIGQYTSHSIRFKGINNRRKWMWDEYWHVWQWWNLYESLWWIYM